MLPELILDSDSFENLIEEYRSQIAGIYPDWTDYNYHDPGITFLELFSWMQENQQYFMEQLGEAHYRQFFRMAGVRPLHRTPARVMAEASLASRDRDFPIPAGTVFISGGLPFETVCDEWVPAARIVRIERRDPKGRTEYYAEKEGSWEYGAMSLAAFGNRPVHGTSMNVFVEGELKAGKLLRLSVMLEDNRRNPMPETADTFDRLIMKDSQTGLKKQAATQTSTAAQASAQKVTAQPMPETAQTPNAEQTENNPALPRLAELKWSYRTASGWKPLTVVEDGTCGLLYSGRISLRMEHGDAAVDPDEPVLRVVFESGMYDAAPVICGISIREIELRQTRTYRWPEGRLLADGNGFPEQEYALPSSDFLRDSIEIRAEEILQPGSFTTWSRCKDIFDAGPEDTCYVADEQNGTVRFGDGVNGLPPEGRIYVMGLSASSGNAGNVKDGSVFRAEDNALRASGLPSFKMTRRIAAGRDPEKTEETLARVIHELRRTRRAVTCRDHEEIACGTPGLILHSAHAWTEEDAPRTVHITVRPGTGEQTLELTDVLKDMIAAHLEEHRLLGTTIQLHSPEYIRVNVNFEFVPVHRYRDRESIILAEMESFFAEKELSYGVTLEFSELYGRLDRLPCIRRINSLQLEPVRAGVLRNSNGDIIPPQNGVFLLGSAEIVLNHYGA